MSSVGLEQILKVNSVKPSIKKGTRLFLKALNAFSSALHELFINIEQRRLLIVARLSDVIYPGANI